MMSARSEVAVSRNKHIATGGNLGPNLRLDSRAVRALGRIF